MGCASTATRDDPARTAQLKQAYDQLHARLEKASGSEPLVASALADGGQVLLAIRSGLIEELAGNVARRYLDRVTLDLHDLEAQASGELGKETFLGHIKLGGWHVTVDLGELAGDLRAGPPRVGLRAPDRIDVDLPVEVQAAEGNATLRFGWDSSGLAGVVCKDFELTRQIRGRVLAQSHRVAGALRLENAGESVTATPVFPDRRVRLKLDLTPASWGVVEEALRSQDTLGKCGLLMDPAKGLVRLKQLAAKGVDVKLPDSIFRAVSLPARVRKSVKLNERTVALRLKARSLRVEAVMVWSSVGVQVESPTKP